MPLPPVPTANTLVARYGDNGYIDPLKLQKLLYFGNGWSLALSGEPLVTERPQVWRYGPVFKTVYSAYASYGNSRIVPSLNTFTPITLSEDNVSRIGSFLDWLWNEYGWRDGTDLSDETHAAGTPWQRIAAANGYEVPSGTTIRWKDDYEWFSWLASQRNWTTKPLNPAFAS